MQIQCSREGEIVQRSNIQHIDIVMIKLIRIHNHVKISTR